MTLDTYWCEKAIQLLIKARGSSWGNTGSTPHFESGESPVSHESSKIPIQVDCYTAGQQLLPTITVARLLHSSTAAAGQPSLLPDCYTAHLQLLPTITVARLLHSTPAAASQPSLLPDS
jgi:hypothetical protein